MKNRYVYIVITASIIGLIIWLTWPAKKSLAPTVNSTNIATVNITNSVDTPINASADRIIFSTSDLPDRDPAFVFKMAIPKTWRVEYLSNVTALNFYDPQIHGISLQQSQMFVQKYTATDFQVLPRRVEPVATTENNNHQAVHDYNLSSSSTKVPPGYPEWWLAVHHVTDIQITNDTSAAHLVLHFAPSVSVALRGTLLTQATFGTE